MSRIILDSFLEQQKKAGKLGAAINANLKEIGYGE
jgi:hypothetical protein